MTDHEDIDALAGEYVLGTLSNAERVSVAVRRASDVELDRAISAWELRLAPLNEAIPEIIPPAGLREVVRSKIAASVSPAARPADNLVQLQRRLNRWRVSALLTGAIAAALGGIIIKRELSVIEPAKAFVAVLQKDAQSPAFLMTVDIASRSFTVRPVAAQTQAGKNYELWIVNSKIGPPKSLGVLSEASASSSKLLASYTPAEIADATYAVSVEPVGGSPTGAPTGPVVFAGKLYQTSP